MHCRALFPLNKNSHSPSKRRFDQGRYRNNFSPCPSMKGHGNPFSVTVDALVGARFLPIMGWCRHNNSHFLRALCTKQYPGVGKDRLVQLVMLHRHDGSPSAGTEVAPMAESRLYKIAHWARAFQRQISGTGVPEIPQNDHRNERHFNCSHPS